MSSGNEIRIWHSLALKCKGGVPVLPEQFIIKASTLLLNIHELQWNITGLAIITNFSKCADKRVKYIIFPYVTLMDDLNSFLKLENFILSLKMFSTRAILNNATLLTLYSLFFFWSRENENREAGRKSVSRGIRVLFHNCNSSLPAARPHFPPRLVCTAKWGPLAHASRLSSLLPLPR